MRGVAGGMLAAALLAAGPAQPTDYWTYQYGTIDVIVAGSSDYARSVARNADRLGVALTRILSLRGEARLPTHIYVLPDEEIIALLGSSGSSNFNSSGYDATVIASRGTGGGDRYWGVYFGYVGSLLAGDGAQRYPYWYRLGVPEVFATTDLDHDHIRTGGVASGYAATVDGGALIPLRTFLGLQEQDPQLQSGPISAMYAAQSWYLTREILLEGRYRREFGKYLGLIHAGRSEQAAFAASFPVSYEDLDRMLRDDRSAKPHVFILPSPTDESPDKVPPRKLTPPEVQTALALVNLQSGRRAEALRLATAVLREDPGNERALRVLARAQLEEGNYPVSFAAVDRLSGGTLSADAMAECAAILTVLAAAVSGGHAALPVDAATLLGFAQRYYQAAIAANPEDLRSWAGLAGLYGARRDRAAAQALLPQATQALARHPGNASLAYALAHMCAQTQQWECAAKFAGVWRENAPTEANRADAAAFESRLAAYQRRLASAPAAPSSAPPRN
ncbi:MAG TPA: tetratricopeptide repeat protein [Steroidobacteraceae bacterium]|nr:tetratricopeptide repeat protein [Steroidobacteraceae bacterium]